jgi:hypothetical protein
LKSAGPPLIWSGLKPTGQTDTSRHPGIDRARVLNWIRRPVAPRAVAFGPRCAPLRHCPCASPYPRAPMCIAATTLIHCVAFALKRSHATSLLALRPPLLLHRATPSMAATSRRRLSPCSCADASLLPIVCPPSQAGRRSNLTRSLPTCRFFHNECLPSLSRSSHPPTPSRPP